MHVMRRYSSRWTIDLMAGRPDPRITKWQMPKTVESEALPLYTSYKIKKERKRVIV